MGNKYNYSKIKLLIDMDDTISDLLPPWVAYLNMKHKFNIDYKMVLDWNIAQYFPGLTLEEVYEPLSTDDFWRTVSPKKDAVIYLKKLIGDGFELYICTNSHYANIEAKFNQVIKKYFPFISWNSFILTSNKQMIKGDILVDDGIHNLIDGDYKKILMTSPHNSLFDAKKNGMSRVDNWKDAYKEIIKQAKTILKERRKTTNGNKNI